MPLNSAAQMLYIAQIL